MTAEDVTAGNDETNKDGTEEGEDVESTAVTSDPGEMGIVLKCVFKNDIERLSRCFEDEEDPYKEIVGELLTQRDNEGKCPLDLAAILGRHAMVKELLNRGVEVNEATGKGYQALHHAAAWGRVECLKVLVDGGAGLHNKTIYDETARDIALRYKQTECVDFLDWADAKQKLADYITAMQDLMADPEKIQGKIDRAEKTSTLALTKEKTEWLESATEATTQDFINQRLQMEETLQPIIQKINEPRMHKIYTKGFNVFIIERNTALVLSTAAKLSNCFLNLTSAE